MAQMQLKMTRFSAPVKERALPEGYRFQFFNGSEAEITEWVRLCNFGLMEGSTRDTFFVDPESDHAARWDEVRAALSYPAVTYVAEDALAKEER